MDPTHTALLLDVATLNMSSSARRSFEMDVVQDLINELWQRVQSTDPTAALLHYLCTASSIDATKLREFVGAVLGTPHLCNLVRCKKMAALEAVLTAFPSLFKTSSYDLLDYAARKGRNDAVGLLLKLGANPNIPDIKGRTLLYKVSEIFDRADTCDILRAGGAIVEGPGSTQHYFLVHMYQREAPQPAVVEEFLRRRVRLIPNEVWIRCVRDEAYDVLRCLFTTLPKPTSHFADTLYVSAKSKTMAEFLIGHECTPSTKLFPWKLHPHVAEYLVSQK